MSQTITAAPPTVDLAAIARRHGRAVAEQELSGGTGRRWALLARDDDHEVWMIAWPHGTGLALHDHDGSAAHVYVVAGRLRERYVTEDRTLATRWLAAGEEAALAADHLHEMVNVDDAEAISVHVYSPPMREVRSPADELRWFPGVSGADG